MAWCWYWGFIPGCCRWSKTAEYRGIRVLVVGWLGKCTGRFLGVWAFFEGVYGIQRVPKTLMGVGGLIWREGMTSPALIQ
jgi:hypothetical protein